LADRVLQICGGNSPAVLRKLLGLSLPGLKLVKAYPAVYKSAANRGSWK
jgi:hypothetical protein